MRLTDEEKAMLDGKMGPAKQRAMELLVRYGEALGAEKLVRTNNVCGTLAATNPFMRDFIARLGGSFEAMFSEFNLDSSETVEIPMVEAFSCQVAHSIDPDHWELLGVPRELYELHRANEEFSARIGVQLMCTCAPYLVGNVPVLGEHCAWMESSAVAYINSVLGARTNVEGRESAGAAMLTGRTPYWGYHITENRLGTHVVEVDGAVDGVADWGVLGYYIGREVKEKVPVVLGIDRPPGLEAFKHFSAAVATSGGVEIYHIPGITPEARSLEEALGGKKPEASLRFGEAERRWVYERLNSSQDRHVDLVVIGCPHASIGQIWQVSKLLQGKRVHRDTALWILTPRPLKQLADRNGYSKVITEAGGVLLGDTCPAMGRFIPEGTRVVATDSVKQAHYLPSILGVQCWFGSLEDCVNAAITGRWGEAR